MTHFTDSELRQWSRSGPGADRERVVVHVGACARCAAAYADAVRSQSFTPEQAAAADASDIAEFVRVGYDVPSKRGTAPAVWTSRLRIYTGLAAAAALIAAIAVPYMLYSRNRSAADVTYRGAGVEALAPTGTVDANTEFEWSTTSPAANYRVDIGDATGLVSSTTTTDTRMRLSPQAWQKLTPGVDYWWTVTALDATGRELASTGRHAFRLRTR